MACSIEMGNARGMRGRHSIGRLHRDSIQFSRWSPAAADALAQGFAGDEFADDVERARFVADVGQGDNVGRIQRGHSAGLALKLGAPFGIVHRIFVQYLERHLAVRTRIARKTSPIPPAPSGARISWGPRREPGASGKNHILPHGAQRKRRKAQIK